MTPAEFALATQVREELASLAYPDRPWVKPVTIDGSPCADVLVVGGGQSGLGDCSRIAPRRRQQYGRS